MPTAFEEKKIRHASGDSTKSADSVSNYIPKPPDGGYGWVIMLASFVNHILVDGISFTFGVFYSSFLEHFNAGSSRTALVGSLLVGTYLMAGPIASALTNKYGCRPVCIAGGVIAAFSFFLSTFSTNINQLTITYGVMAGFGFGLVYLPSVISVSFYFEKRRSLATGIAVCGAGVGCFLFAPFANFLLEKLIWQNALMVQAGLVLLSCGCGALLRPLKPTREPPKPREKNVLDRLVETTKSHLGLQRSDSVYSTRTAAKVNGQILEKVLEMKKNREKLVREELGESEPNSVLSSAYLPSQNASRMPSRSCSVVEKTEPVPIPGRRPADVRVPQIVLETGEDEEMEAAADAALLTEISRSSAQEPRTAIYRPAARSVPTGVSPVSGKDLQIILLQKKLAQIKQQNGGGGDCAKGEGSNGYDAKMNGHNTVLGSAPTVFLNGGHTKTVTLTDHSEKPREFHSDMWTVKRRLRNKNMIDGHEKEDYARPMYRKDIFYSGSVANVPEFKQSNQEITTYLKSITSIPEEVPKEEEKGVWRCCGCLPKTFTDVLKTVFTFSILRDPVFIIACIANMVGFLGIFVPFVFIAERAISLGVSKNQATWLLSIIGLANTIGRVLVGCVGDIKWVNTLALHNVAIVLAGVCCMLNTFCVTFPMMCVFASVFGLCFAAWISLTTIVLVNLMGMDRLTNAFGLLTLARGICSVAGAPMAGIVYELTKNYDMAFHVGGGLLVIAGLFFSLLHLPCLKPKRLEKEALGKVVVETPTTVVATLADHPEEASLLTDSDYRLGGYSYSVSPPVTHNHALLSSNYGLEAKEQKAEGGDLEDVIQSEPVICGVEDENEAQDVTVEETQNVNVNEDRALPIA